MEEIYKKTLLLIHSLTQMNGICNQFFQSPNNENGEKIVEIVDKCEEKFLKVKEEIVKMVREVEESISDTESDSENIDYGQEISAIKTDGGFLINDRNNK